MQDVTLLSVIGGGLVVSLGAVLLYLVANRQKSVNEFNSRREQKKPVAKESSWTGSPARSGGSRTRQEAIDKAIERNNAIYGDSKVIPKKPDNWAETRLAQDEAARRRRADDEEEDRRRRNDSMTSLHSTGHVDHTPSSRISPSRCDDTPSHSHHNSSHSCSPSSSHHSSHDSGGSSHDSGGSSYDSGGSNSFD